MPFEWRVFELAKEPEHPDQNQDAWWLNAQEGVAAIADGVTSGIFSRHWAQMLTRAAVDDWPDPADESRFPEWLAGLRARWHDEIDTSGLAWYQRAKLREGGFSTLVWLRLLDNAGLGAGEAESGAEVLAIGDSCLFHVRDDEMLESFPLDTSEQFDSSPLVLGSVDLRRDDQLQFERLKISCRVGDLLVLCTDAIAAWALECREQGDPVAWSKYWDMPPETWVGEVCSLRRQSKMRYDDATLVLLRVGQVPGEPAEQYAPPEIEVLEVAAPEEDADVDLLAVDDWETPGIPDEPPTSSEEVSDEPTYTASETYRLESPAPEPAPDSSLPSAEPPPLPPGAKPGLPPPPRPQTPTAKHPGEDWRDQVNTISERIFKKLSEGLSRGVDKLQEAKDSAVKKLRERKGGTSKEDERGPPDA